MEEEKRTVNNSLDVRGKTIGTVMRWYFDGQVWVNRKYQRKLVWSLGEKQLFVDSIINKFPTPAMILASYDLVDTDEHRYEIIDGMQRLNAIVSFVLGEFPVSYKDKMCFFNLGGITHTHIMAIEGEMKQPEPALPLRVCEEFAEYELPLILTGQSNEKIEEIFRRINSCGKKLSPHDLRQSGSCDSFADLVRRVASSIRGDMTYFDLVNLSDMPKISISNKGLHYGVECSKIFWRRHDIVTFEDIRDSRDEELIARILGEILVPKIGNPYSWTLKDMYDSKSELNCILNQKVEELTRELLEEKMKQIFDVVEMTFNAVGSDFSSWMFTKRKSPGKNDCFRVVFLALYQLYQEGYCVDNYSLFAKKIENFAEEHLSVLTTGNKIPKEVWQRARSTTYALFKSMLSEVVEHTITEEEKEIERRLNLSSIESQMTEFKIGISNFNSGEIKQKTVHRIAIALSAMANTNCAEDGYVILGIADSFDAGRDWEQAYDTQALIYNGHYVTGVEQEAVEHFNGIDQYYNRIGELLSKEPMDEELKEFVLANYKQIDFRDRKLILIPSRHFGRDIAYDGKIANRQGSRKKRQN